MPHDTAAPSPRPDAAAGAVPPGTPAPRRPWRKVVWPLLLAAALALALGWWRSVPGEHGVTLEQARADLEAGRALLVDLREPDEHATGVAAGALLLPMRQLASRLDEIPRDPSRPVLLICATQNRSRATLEALQARGHSNVRYVHGGMSGWAARGWPMVAPAVQAAPAR
jgi:rhodanese-related sulfurtransferase